MKECECCFCKYFDIPSIIFVAGVVAAMWLITHSPDAMNALMNGLTSG